MLLHSVRVRDFLGIKTADVALHDFNVLYGANGAGKTSLVDAVFHVLTGASLRGSTLPELVRQGARSFDVEIIVEDTAGKPVSLMRRRARSGKGECFVDGVLTGETEFVATVERVVGSSIRAIVSVLRAGALLELRPSDLLSLLAGLSGATFDADAIAEAVGEEAATAAAGMRIPLPVSLEGFAGVEQRAVTIRQEQKLIAESLRNDLARMPVLSVPEGATEASLATTLRGLRARRDVALRTQPAADAHAAGAYEAKMVALRERRAVLDAVPAADAAEHGKALATLTAATGEKATATRAVSDATREVERLTLLAAGSIDWPTGAAKNIEAQLAHAEADALTAARTAERITTEGKRLRALADSVTAGVDCPTCATHLTIEHKTKLEADVESLHTESRAAQQALRTATELVTTRRGIAAETKAVAARQQAQRQLEQATIARDTAKLAETTAATRHQVAVEREAAARPAAVAAAKFADARREIAQVDAALAVPPPVVPVAVAREDVGALDAQIATAEVHASALVTNAEIARAQAKLDQAIALIADADFVAKACGPRGARARLLAAAVGPFLEAANTALAQLAPGFAVEVETDPTKDFGFVVVRGEGDACTRLRPSQLSDGERMRVLYVLQLAIVRLADVPLLVLDRAEMIDETGKKALKRLAAACSAEGIQIAMLTCAAPPPVAPDGLNAWVIDNGSARPIATRAA